MNAGQDDERLTRLIKDGARKDCLAFIADTPAADRRSFAKPAIEALKEIENAWYAQSAAGKRPTSYERYQQQLDNARLFILASATISELKKLGWRATPQDGSLAETIAELQPDWVDEWVSHLAKAEPRTYHDIRLLYEAGLCEKPADDGYILGMIECLPGWTQSRHSRWDRDTPLAERIRRTPDIRDEDVWRLFEVEGGGDLSLSAFDKYIGGKIGSWSAALVELSADGTLSRERLLDESLNALERDFAQFRAGWFSRFHELLTPTIAERFARRAQYLRLIGSSIAPTVSFALKALTLLDKASELPPEELLTFVGPALQARAKGTVTTALRLVANAVKRKPELCGEAAILATKALIHEAADVQKKALDLIETLGSGNEVAAAMSDYADAIAPSLRTRFSEITGVAAAPNPGSEPALAPAAKALAAIEAIGSFDELISELLHVLEDASEPLRIDRVIAGLAAHGADKPGDFDKRAGPLRKRAASIIKHQPDDQLRYQVAWLAHAYASFEMLRKHDNFRYPSVDIAPYSPGAERERRSFESVFAMRNAEVLTQVLGGRRLPLLSAPTDSRGFVAAERLIERITSYRAANVEPGKTDMALALLRLSPDGRDAALKMLSGKDEYEQAIAYALGADESVGETDWLWVAAGAARLPYTEQPALAKKHGHGLPDAGTMARYVIGFRRTDYYTWLHLNVGPRIAVDVPPDFLTTTFHLSTAGKGAYGSVCGYHVNMIRWSSTVWPLNMEAFFSQGVFVFDHSQRLANSPYAGFIEPMLASHVRIGEIGAVLLALGMASSDPAVKGVAMDAAISSIDEDRIELASLGGAFAMLLPSGHAPVGRWTRSLGELSGISGKHARVVRDLIVAALSHDPQSSPRDFGGLLELLYEVSIALKLPVSEASALSYLRRVTSGGKLGRFAGKLLAMQATDKSKRD